MTTTTKRGRGRPALYTGAIETALVKLIKLYGLLGTQKHLSEVGIQKKPGIKKVTMKISLPTLGKIAARHDIKLNRGKPSKKEVAPF